ncbi:MAG: hypothetical protein K2M44_02280 [Clostridia bacterium]|nr:hypothetical protein [Clostridia bacterium]
MKNENATWNNFLALTWDKYLPPIRPYTDECEIFKSYVHNFIIEHNAIPQILILGSTPELRDLVYEFGIIPTVVDFAKDNYEGMSLLCKNKGQDNFIESNWLELAPKNCAKKFDFILSEAAFNVLSRDSAKRLYAICKELLNEHGKIIAKQWVRLSNKRPSLENLLEDYRNSNSTMGMYSHICIPLMLCFYDYSIERITLRDLEKNVRKLYETKLITQNEWETINLHDYQNVDLELYIPLLQQFLSDMNECFNLINLHVVDKGFAQFHPIFVFERV